jgi:hypothetical protein
VYTIANKLVIEKDFQPTTRLFTTGYDSLSPHIRKCAYGWGTRNGFVGGPAVLFLWA